MLSPHIRYSDKTIKSYQSKEARTKTPDTASSRVLEDAWLHLSPENRSEYRNLSSVFEPRTTYTNPRTSRIGSERPMITTRSCEISQYSKYLSSPRQDSSSSITRSSRQPSLDLTTQSFFLCDEPEFQNDPSVLAIQDTVTEIIVTPAQFAFKLYISGLKAANDLSALKEYDIRAILSLGTTNIPSHYNFIQAYTSLPFPNSSHNITAGLSQAIHFLEYELNRHNVLVHCYHGVNRSIVVVAAYLMKHLHISHLDAINILAEARQVTKVSDWLMSQLESFELETEHSPL